MRIVPVERELCRRCLSLEDTKETLVVEIAGNICGTEKFEECREEVDRGHQVIVRRAWIGVYRPSGVGPLDAIREVQSSRVAAAYQSRPRERTDCCC